MVNNICFGEKLKELRTNAGMTQTELAKRLSITKSVVSYYELQERTPSPDVLIQLADIFHVTTDYLLDIDKVRTVDVSNLTEQQIDVIVQMIKLLENN